MGPFWGCTGYPDCTTTINDLNGKPSQLPDAHYRCPVCTRRLVRSNKGDTDYWFCSGYSKGCKVKLADNEGFPETAYQCHRCGQLLVKRTGKNGAFWGCNGYPDCRASHRDKDNRPQY
jgi:ssDNA-binding Zn-finger/Zn-ribbon topoisomerase 1